MTKSITLSLTAEKKHSVRYDVDDEFAIVKTVYVTKSELPKPFPKQVNVKVEW